MRYTRIDVEGDAGLFASITRKRGSEFIDVEIITPDGSRMHHVGAADRQDQWSMAECLHESLEGCRGMRRDVSVYYTAIQYLAD